MKSSLRDAAAFGLMLVLGIGLGIGLQKSFDISAQAVNLLQQAGLVRPDGGDGSADVLSDAVESTVPERLQGKLKLYVLVGQSNMVGAARVPDDINPSANIYTFGNDYRWAVATEPVDSARNQIDRVSADPAAGFGPALTFAKTLVAEDSNQLIGLIPCAKDGSSITDWQRSLSSQSLYGSCLKRVLAASPMGTISGILFFQGEADTIDPQRYPNLQPDAEAWAEKFATFAYNFRNDIGQPNLPLVYAQLGQPDDLEGLPNWAMVQAQQENIQIPNGTMIKTDDLPMDGIHFTVEGYKTIGERFADAIAKADAVSPGTPNGESAPPESAQ